MRESIDASYHRNRALLIVGAAASVLMFWFAGKWFAIPTYVRFNASLLQQPHWIASLIVVAITILLSTVVCTLIAGSVRSDAGIFCTALGLTALAVRGGPMRYTLVDAGGTIFYALAIEAVLLYAMFAIAWMLVGRLRDLGLSRRTDEDYFRDDLPRDQKLLATALQACATATLVLILCQNDNKIQALASVGLASMIGSMIAMLIAPTRPSIWFWPGPLLAALLGYVWAAFSPQNLPIGRPGGYFAALARPLPLHYASAGIAGAMLGYWFARSWGRDIDESEDLPEPSSLPRAPG